MSNDVRRRVTYRVRRSIGPFLDRAVRTVVDETYEVKPSEYAATAHCRIDDLESELSEYGFRWNPLSMYHYTQLGNRTNGSWVLRSSPLADRQLHAILVKVGPEQIHVYAHEEYSWLRHPVKHAREVDLDRAGGADRMRRILSEIAIDTAEESITRRKVKHATRQVRKGISELLPV
ncbi:hypothetical protein BRC79_03875 [Halobacteriales archaeon QH_8_67_27]|nr:MAG: hypothetical protein BRC79_03875 [Halobacteriales archaeon QH_8_67_27]